MKKLIAAATLALLLTACGGADNAADADAPAEVAQADTPASSAGTYVGGAAGEEMTSVLAADGTFSDTLNGEVVRSGTWEDNIRGTCFTEEGVEGDMCYNMGAPAADGMVDVTGPDGTTTKMKKTA